MRPSLLCLAVTCLVSSLSGCGSSAPADMTNEAKNLGRRKVIHVVPELLNDRQSEILMSKRYKIVAFINGHCSACIEDLKCWREFQDEIVQECGVQIPCVFYIGVDNFERVRAWVKNYKISDVVIDSDSKFLKENNLEDKNPLLHCFLLGPENEPILIGSPLRNPKLSALYKTTILKLAAEESGFRSVGIE